MSLYRILCCGSIKDCVYRILLCVGISLMFYGYFKYKSGIQFLDSPTQVSNMEIRKANMKPVYIEDQPGNKGTQFLDPTPLASNIEIRKTNMKPVYTEDQPGDKENSITSFTPIVDASRQSVFQYIYNRSLWGKGGGGSGLGSTIKYTALLRKNLLEFISHYNLSSMADVPCGAMLWTEVFLKSVWQERPFFKYLGMDITKSVVKQLQERWKDNAKVTIKLADLVSSLPDINVDFILTRDALQHMPLKDACLAIENLINLGDNVKYVLIGTYPKSSSNKNIKTGDYHSINVMKHPFNLPEPHLIIKEIRDVPQKYVYVFKMKDLQTKQCQICTAYVKRNKCP